MFYDERLGSKPRYAVSGVPYSCSELWLTKVSKPGDSDIRTDPMRKFALTGIRRQIAARDIENRFTALAAKGEKLHYALCADNAILSVLPLISCSPRSSKLY